MGDYRALPGHRRAKTAIKQQDLAPRPLQSKEGWILFVTNLHEETSEDDIVGHFGEYGKVINVNLNLDRRTGFVKGYCLVEYQRYQDATNARENLNGSQMLGAEIKVDWTFVHKQAK